jgi:hydroxymethylpyrimidine/phosphomethylpyrimidine kinase
MMEQFPQALSIAGSDSGGGAGMQADLKTIHSRHVFATTVLVAITAQNTLGVQDALPLPPAMIDAQFASLAADLQIRACKTGMLADVPTVQAVVANLRRYHFGPLVVDPVMIAKGGAKLLADDAIAVVRDQLLPLATLVTPNLPEAEQLTGLTITDHASMRQAAAKLLTFGAQNVLVKGGHLSAETDAADYVLLADGSEFWLPAKRIATVRTHGTGDTISACITAELAKGRPLAAAIRTGKAYVEAAIKDGIVVGHGHGPLNHWAYPEAAHED